jgi:hypothetical protein
MFLTESFGTLVQQFSWLSWDAGFCGACSCVLGNEIAHPDCQPSALANLNAVDSGETSQSITPILVNSCSIGKKRFVADHVLRAVTSRHTSEKGANASFLVR